MAVRARLTSNAGELAKRWQGRAAGVLEAQRRACQATRKDLYKNIYRFTPEASGKLREGLYTRVERTATGFAVVGGFKGVPYARAVEKGRKAVDIYPNKKKALAFDMNGFPVVVKRVHQEAREGVWMQRRGQEATRPVFNRNLRRELRKLYLGVR